MSVNTPNKQTSHLKREILVRLIKAYLGDNYAEDVRLIPYRMRPQGSDIQFRCCIHKERAIQQIIDIGSKRSVLLFSLPQIHDVRMRQVTDNEG